MTSRRRLVRFRDLLPASVVQRASGAIDDEPLFSPTIEQPKLLHSIFSPTNENGVENQGNRDREGLSFLSPLFKMQPRQHSTQNSHTALRPVINQCDRTTEDLNSANGAKVTAYGEQTMAPTTPLRKNSEPCLYSSVVKNPGRLQQRSPSIPDVTSIYISPTHTALSSLAVSMDADLFSPLSTKTVRDVDLSKNSVKSAHSTTTTFQMLEKTGCFTFEHITTCKSVSTLVRIISVLESSFCEPKYPSLLRAAHKRLLALHGLPENSSDSRISPNTVMASDLFSSALPADSNCHNNTTQTSSSLIMSISTDRDDESHYTSPPTNISPPSQAPSATELSASRFHPTATDRGFSETELHLWKQVQRLTQTIAEMEQTGADDFYHRLLLQNQDEPKEVETLEEHVDNKELLRSVEQLRERNHKLQEQIQLETAAREQKLMQSAAIEERLSVELKQLQNQLAETAQASTATETHLQRQHERLQQLLFTTQANLRRIQSDREALIQCMLQAVGRNNHNEVGQHRFWPPENARVVIAYSTLFI